MASTDTRPDPGASGGQTNSRWPAGHPRRRQILLVLCLSLLIVVIDNTILNTALPTLARVLHAGTSALQWITDAYTLCFAALLIPAGALGDIATHVIDLARYLVGEVSAVNALLRTYIDTRPQQTGGADKLAASDKHSDAMRLAVDVDDEVSRMGDPVPPMFWLRDPEGNVLMIAEA